MDDNDTLNVKSIAALVQSDIDSPSTSTFLYKASSVYEQLSQRTVTHTVHVPELSFRHISSFQALDDNQINALCTSAKEVRNALTQLSQAYEKFANVLTTTGTCLANTTDVSDDTTESEDADLSESARLLLSSTMIKVGVLCKDMYTSYADSAQYTYNMLVFPWEELMSEFKKSFYRHDNLPC